MLLTSIGSQWLKLSVLRKNLPNKQREDVKSLLRLPQTQAGPHPYYDVKMQLLKLYSIQAKDRFKIAMGRVLTGLPSQLGKQLVDDICKLPIKLQGCCCASAVLALWTNQLPVSLNAHISNMTFDFNTYQSVFDHADQVFLSAKSMSNVAALTDNATPSGYSMTADSDDPLNTKFSEKQVSAVQRNKNQTTRGGRGNRGNRNSQNRNQQSQNQNTQTTQKPRKGPRHSSNPPQSCCDLHFTKGADAWYCLKPLTCPWKDKISERP